ncbi:hypothetical protein ES705_12081 [subsurface metagenome]
MDLDNSAFVLRQRSPFEALDAGILLYRKFYRKLCIFFVPIFLIVTIAARLLPSHLIFLSYIIVWWLKPFWDRLVLYPLSVYFFEQDAKFKSIFHLLTSYVFKGLIADLTIRRFSPWRSYRMPVRMLEKGGSTGSRISFLAKRGQGTAFLLTIFILGLEIVLLSGEIGFFIKISSLISPELLFTLNWYDPWVEPVIYSLFALHIMFLEPLYTAMGFSLYLNVRITFEAWDLRLAFEKLTAERKYSVSRNSKILLLLLYFLFFSPDQITYSQETAADKLEQILLSPDFGGTEEKWNIRLRDDWKSFSQRKNNSKGFQLPLLNPGENIGYIMRAILIGLFVGAAIFFGVSRLGFHSIAGRNSGGKDEKKRRDGTLNPEELYSSENLLRKAKNRYYYGNEREAWILLFSAFIKGLDENMGIKIPKQATEGECLLILKNIDKVSEQFLQGFTGIVTNLRSVVYAGKKSDASLFSEADAFYYSIFDANGETAASEK